MKVLVKHKTKGYNTEVGPFYSKDINKAKIFDLNDFIRRYGWDEKVYLTDGEEIVPFRVVWDIHASDGSIVMTLYTRKDARSNKRNDEKVVKTLMEIRWPK